MASDGPQEIFFSGTWQAQKCTFGSVPIKSGRKRRHREGKPMAGGQLEDDVHEHLTSEGGREKAFPADSAQFNRTPFVGSSRSLVTAQEGVDSVCRRYSRAMEADER